MLTYRLFMFVTVFCSSPFVFAQNHAGLFSVVKGSVTVESKGKKNSAKVSDKVFPGDVLVTGPDSRAKLTMEDRTTLNLSENSKLTIESFPAKGEKKGVLLNLSHGKLRNEVKNTYDDKNKYEVKTPTAVAGVRGTDFVVNHNIKTNTTEVQTLLGSVSFSALKNGVPTGSPVLVKFNEQAAALPNAPVGAPKMISPEERTKIEGDSKVIESPSASAPTAPRADSGTTPKARIGDTKDTVPANFDQVPKSPTTVTGPGTTPTRTVLPTTAPNPRLNDAIRDKTDKTKVIIKPEGR